MPTSNLRQIRAFPELVRYLEEELDWPLQEYGFDDLTFEYTPSELGLKEEDAARIKAIHQLRPLASGQPWGIFFVEFENKKLPVVVLRRILSHLAVKKRASANKASAPAWHAEDLLFITAFGEDGTDAREIAFAHFHQNPGDMPTLHVLGWDGGDTPLKYDHVDQVLRERLRWPADEKDTQSWRETWSQPFKHRIGYIIQTSSLLAEELASLARGIRDKAKLLLAAESEKGEITKLYKAFQTALIHDLTPESFADTYAQTITYGLLTAAISRTDISEGRYGTFVKADDIADMVPITNPFLKEMLQTFLKVGGRKGGIDFDELGIQDVVELLRGDETDLPAILRDFGNKTRGEDPVIHFYEHFLSAYNKKLKIQRGVFYTPQPVVSYIVRSVHELLQTEFGLEDGLASTITWGEMLKKHPELKLPPLTDAPNEARTISPGEPFVVILDPATGTATFLVEVINVIHRTLTEKWTKQGMNPAQRLEAWNDYVPKHLLPRLYGYELMMAPYAIAHMKIGLKLAETGYRFASNERVRIYLTNALEPWQRQLKLPDFEALAHEAIAVNEVKRERRFTVVVGNPPYASISANMTPWIRDQTNAYLFINGSRIEEKSKRNHLQNDYIKFIRLADLACQLSSYGVIGYITSNSYLDGRTLRGLRWNLLQHYPQLAILNLYGDSNKGDAASDDENIFDITEGVCIILAARTPRREQHETAYAELQGSRQSKYRVLQNPASNIPHNSITALASHYLFRPLDSTIRAEFLSIGPSLDRIYHVSGAGMKSNRDDFVTGEDKSALLERMHCFADAGISDDVIRSKFELKDNYVWKLPKARADFRTRKVSESLVKPLSYRPFDNRYVYFDKAVVFNPRLQIMNHMVRGDNLAIVSIGQNESKIFNHAFVSRHLVEIKMATHYGASIVFPIYLHRHEPGMFDESARTNLTLEATSLSEIAKFDNASGIPVDLRIAQYIYAILYSQKYRDRYAEPLLADFPHVPTSPPCELFVKLSRLGGELVALHLLESPKLDQPITEFIGGKNPEVEKPSWSDNTVWVDKAQSTGFKGVREEVWNFHIGGYQVCAKWLKDRKGRTLTQDDLAHYQKIVIALSETIRLMAEIDKVIETYGGWPGAFQASADEAPT